MNTKTKSTTAQSQQGSHCMNCGALLSGPFCAQCGQEIKSRITLKNIFADFWDTLVNIDRGFIYTLKLVFTSPGKVINDYLSGKTRPYMNPLRYALVLAGLTVLLNIWLGIFDEQQSELSSLFAPQVDEEALQEYQKNQEMFNKAVRPYLNLVPLILIPFSAFFFWRFTRKSLGFNYAENIVIGLFIQGQLAFIGIFLTLTFFLHHDVNLLLYLGLANYVIYYAYTYQRLMQSSWLKSGGYALLAMILGYASFIILVTVLTFLILLVMNFMGLI